VFADNPTIICAYKEHVFEIDVLRIGARNWLQVPIAVPNGHSFSQIAPVLMQVSWTV
jgi:hypothetical protein